MKICTKCKQELSIDDFYKDHGRPGSWCRPCKKENNKRYFSKERQAKSNRKWSQKLKQAIIDYYGGKCSCNGCGIEQIEFLTIEHKNGDGKKHREEIRKYGANFYRWIRDNKPDYLTVLCWNCNSSRGMHGYCPHEKDK